MGANPVQVEMGEFEDGAEETVEEVVADSKSLPCHLAYLDHPRLSGWNSKDSSQEVSSQGDALWASGNCGGPAGNPRVREVWDRSVYSQAIRVVNSRGNSVVWCQILMEVMVTSGHQDSCPRASAWAQAPLGAHLRKLIGSLNFHLAQGSRAWRKF